MKPTRTAATRLALLSILAAFAAAPLAAQNGAAPVAWTPEHSMEFHGISDVELSPDGSQVAYVVREPMMEGEDSKYRSNIWVAAADGSRRVQYTRGDETNASPAFSPDGTLLAFLSNRGGKDAKRQVWIMPLRGGEPYAATKAKSGVAGFRWSPDGSRIAYTMQDPKTEEEEKAEKEKRDVIIVGEDYEMNHLYVVPLVEAGAEVEEATRLTEGEFHVTSFDWSPDGRTIVFAHAPDPEINTLGIAQDVAVVPSGGGAVRQLVTQAGSDANPVYSPDGRWIAFTSHGGQPERVGLADLYVIPAAGGQFRKLADTPDRSANLIRWTADSQAVLALEFIGTERHLLAVPVDGGAPRVLSQGGDGVIGSVGFDRGTQRVAFVWEDVDTPEEVYVADVARFQKRKVSAVNDDVAIPPMGKTEVVSWKSKDGKYDIEGLITYPVDYQEGRRYPLILTVHGGPAGVFGESFTGAPGIYMIQYFADQGYAVLRPNPRGSTGYGRDFRYANIRDWGFGDYEDLMAGVDWAIDRGIAHADSLAVMGWSYGGYMTSWVVTQTDRFKAASMGAGLPNLVSMVTTTDIGDYLVAHMGGKEFWEDYEEYEKHSAIYHIANTKTPTQVIHGAQDLRVPFTQGQEFYTALKRLGVPTQFVVYPRTPHGPQEPKFLLDVSHRINAWFDKHLKGEGRPVTQ